MPVRNSLDFMIVLISKLMFVMFEYINEWLNLNVKEFVHMFICDSRYLYIYVWFSRSKKWTKIWKYFKILDNICELEKIQLSRKRKFKSATHLFLYGRAYVSDLTQTGEVDLYRWTGERNHLPSDAIILSTRRRESRVGISQVIEKREISLTEEPIGWIRSYSFQPNSRSFIHSSLFLSLSSGIGNIVYVFAVIGNARRDECKKENVALRSAAAPTCLKLCSMRFGITRNFERRPRIVSREGCCGRNVFFSRPARYSRNTLWRWHN